MDNRKMVQENDWRRMGQEGYLQGVTLIWKKYIKFSKNWEHDHCEFCGAKFMETKEQGSLSEGYATEDNYRWVCKQCFCDFKSEFEWVVEDGHA